MRRWSSPRPPRRSNAGLTPGRDLAVEENRQAELLAHPIRELERCALRRLELLRPDGDEGHHVRGADARMDAVVQAEVDPLARARDAVDERVDELRRPIPRS